MRCPSGDRTAPPTERKRERSLLINPCALLEGAEPSRANAQNMKKPTRTKIDCGCKRIEFFPPKFLNEPSRPRSCFARSGPWTCGTIFTSNICPSNQPSCYRHPSGEQGPQENAPPREKPGTSPVRR